MEFKEWLISEGGIPGPSRPINVYRDGGLSFQSLPMRDMSERGMGNLVRYLREAGQDVVHDEGRNATLLRLEAASAGEKYLVLNYDGTWHLERVIQ